MTNRKVLVYVAIMLLLSVGLSIAASTYTVPQSGTVSYGVSDGPSVSVTGDINTTGVWTDSTDANTVQLETSAGNLTASSQGQTDFTVDSQYLSDSQWFNMTSITAGSTWIDVRSDVVDRFEARGDVNALSVYENIQIDDGQADYYYSGTDGGLVSVRLYNLPADTRIAAINSTGYIKDETTTDATGQATFDMGASSHTIFLQSFDSEAPTLSNPDPTGLLDHEPSNLSIDVNDPELGSGDEVTVTIDLDGSQIHQEAITSNSTVTASIPSGGLTGGEHTWEVLAEDDFGESTEDSYSYSVPDQLFIRNELDHSELVKDPINSTVTFFGPEETYQRDVSDGIVDLDGLPVSSDMTVTAEPSDSNWTSRVAFIQSIYEQQSVYLLNISAVDSVVQNRFVLDDPTGEYGSQTTLFIQRPIEINGSTLYQTIHADQFGVEGVTASLEEGVRYRIKVKAEDGTTQIVGPYRAELAETVTVEPGTPGIEIQQFKDGLGYDARIDNTTVYWSYSDPKQTTDQLTVWIHEKGNTSNLLVANQTYFDLGNASYDFTIDVNDSDKAWKVNFVVGSGGETTIYHDIIQNQRDLFAQLAPGWQAAIGVSLLVLFAGAFSVLNAAIGAVIVSLAGGLLWWIGLLSGVTSAMAVAIALFISVAYYLAGGGRP